MCRDDYTQPGLQPELTENHYVWDQTGLYLGSYDAQPGRAGKPRRDEVE